jgi:cAMP and cAMP-inhibited cGMP 3',5'-cyclic phosphodiesterase 10
MLQYVYRGNQLFSFVNNHLKKEVIFISFYQKLHIYRRLVHTIVMTGCDLVASAKPWKMQLDTVKYIFEEFYQQVVQGETVCSIVVTIVTVFSVSIPVSHT